MTELLAGFTIFTAMRTLPCACDATIVSTFPAKSALLMPADAQTRKQQTNNLFKPVFISGC
jgi:hypothetical protein